MPETNKSFQLKKTIIDLLFKDRDISDSNIINQIIINPNFANFDTNKKGIGIIKQQITKVRKEISNQNQKRISKVSIEKEQAQIAIYRILQQNIGLKSKQIQQELGDLFNVYQDCCRTFQRHIRETKKFIKDKNNNNKSENNLIKQLNQCTPITNLEIKKIENVIQNSHKGRLYKKNKFFEIIKQEAGIDLDNRNITCSVIQTRLGHLYQQKKSQKNNSNNNNNNNVANRRDSQLNQPQDLDLDLVQDEESQQTMYRNYQENSSLYPEQSDYESKSEQIQSKNSNYDVLEDSFQINIQQDPSPIQNDQNINISSYDSHSTTNKTELLQFYGYDQNQQNEDNNLIPQCGPLASLNQNQNDVFKFNNS